MSILKTIFQWLLDWAWGLLQKWIAEKEQKRQEDKAVDKIIDKTKSPDLKDQLDGVDDAEDHLNSNA